MVTKIQGPVTNESIDSFLEIQMSKNQMPLISSATDAAIKKVTLDGSTLRFDLLNGNSFEHSFEGVNEAVQCFDTLPTKEFNKFYYQAYKRSASEFIRDDRHRLSVTFIDGTIEQIFEPSTYYNIANL